jgi:hypothetical protein
MPNASCTTRFAVNFLKLRVERDSCGGQISPKRNSLLKHLSGAALCSCGSIRRNRLRQTSHKELSTRRSIDVEKTIDPGQL